MLHLRQLHQRLLPCYQGEGPAQPAAYGWRISSNPAEESCVKFCQRNTQCSVAKSSKQSNSIDRIKSGQSPGKNWSYDARSQPRGVLWWILIRLVVDCVHGRSRDPRLVTSARDHLWPYPPKRVTLTLFMKFWFLHTCKEHSFSFQMIPTLCKSASRFKVIDKSIRLP